MRLTVGTFNIEHLGGKNHAHLDDALEFLLEHTPNPPDILALPEATNCLAGGQDILRRRVVYPLAHYLNDGWYEPFYASSGLPYQANHHHLLLVNVARIRPIRWHDPSHVHGQPRHLAGFLKANVDGHQVWVCCEHWSGGEGRGEFWRAATRLSTLGREANKTLLLGDFNATSSWEREYWPDWEDLCTRRGERYKLLQKGWWNPHKGRWEIDPRQIDYLRRECGFVDMGEESGDPTITTHPEEGSSLRIDRIFRSRGFAGKAIEYRAAQPPREISDHAYVYGAYHVDEERVP